MSPSDIVGPSPVTSNGTEITEIEDEATEGILEARPEDVYERRRQSEVCAIYLAPLGSTVLLSIPCLC